MSYLVLARKYRPQSFDDLVGQSHVAKTLANAITQNRVAHAFLFTGVRGVGKTTSARLLAKCLNCLGPDGKATGPVVTPCQVCAACTEIAQGLDMDVQEIDGASYNGVDEVRRLQEGLAFRPARDRYKIYIVDEVHMLSNAAWNAFLKTLEEPPPHVKFIFATTEVHKVPITILSRCQRYDFKLISAQMIATRLREVLTTEKIQADDGAVSILSREAAGSMRDAMSLLDQVIAFSGEKMTSEDVARVLGVADRQVLHDLSAAVVKGDAAKTLDVLGGLAEHGYDLVHVARDFLRHLRDLVVTKVCASKQNENEAELLRLVELAGEELADLRALADTLDTDDLLRIFQGFSKSFDDIAKSGQPRAALEMTLVRLARRPPLLPLDELLSRLGDLEKRLAGGTPPPPTRGGSGGGRVEGGSGGGRVSGSTSRPSASGASPSSTSAPHFVAPAFDVPPPSEAPRSVPPVMRALPSPNEPRMQRPQFTDGALALAEAPMASPDPTTPAPPPSREQAIEPKPLILPPAETVAAWRAILAKVRETRSDVAAALEQAAPTMVTAARLELTFKEASFEGGRATEPEALEILTLETRAHFGAQTEIAIELTKRAEGLVASVAQIDAEAARQAKLEAENAVRTHPLVTRAISLFEAQLQSVRVPSSDD